MSSSNPPSSGNTSDNSRPKMLFEVVQEKIRIRHLSRFTEKNYMHWIRRFIYFHNKQHPKTMDESHIESFLSHLAVSEEVSPSTQNQALNAIVFLFRFVLQRELGKFTQIRWAKRKVRIPVVLTRDEISRSSLYSKKAHNKS